MSNEIIPSSESHLVEAGQIANKIAGAGVFEDYQSRKAPNTNKRQANDLVLFADYLSSAGLAPGSFAEDPQAWTGVSWGLVAGFARWLLAAGYAVGSVNVLLSTIKVYASLAAKAGALDRQELVLIQAVKGYRRSEGKHLDELRESEGVPTRRVARWNGTRAGKKAQPVSLTLEQAKALKAQPDTPQGRRDCLIMCLLLDHGLRVGEAARLTVDCFDLKAGKMTFYRPKVDKIQTHKLTPNTLAAARAYWASDAPGLGSIWRGSRKGGELTEPGMTARAITERVRVLGEAQGIPGLSAHDCRHYWATLAGKNTPVDRLMDAGGWSSPAMPLHYIERARIANEGVRLAP